MSSKLTLTMSSYTVHFKDTV